MYHVITEQRVTDKPRPPFESRLDDLKWRYQRALRRFRRMRGLPATEDIGTLAVMIRNLKVLSEAKLGQHIQEAAITIPSLPKLVRDDLFYAAQYAGIYQLVPLPHTSQELDETLAARAGMGYGMCEHWEDFVECYYEELEFPPKRVLSISFTNDSLTVSNIMIYPPQSMLDAWAKDYLLGYAFRYETQNLWGRVGELVRTVAMQVEGGKIEELIIMGECAEEKKFLNAIWQALGDLEKKGFVEGRFMDVYAKLQVPGFSALYVGSRGAAEIARRTRIQLDRLGREDL